MNEADTCRRLITPKLQQAGWDSPPPVLNEQHTFTDGRIGVVGDRARRRERALPKARLHWGWLPRP